MSMDAGATLGLAIIPPAIAIFFEAVNPLRHRFVDSSVERDLDEFRVAADTTPPLTHTHDELVEKVSAATRAAIEIAMLALTGVSVITSGFAIIHEFDEPYWPAIGYVIFFMVVGLLLWRLLAGYTLYEVDEHAAFTIRISGQSRSFSRSDVITYSIYLLNGALIIFAFGTLGVPESWKGFILNHFVLVPPQNLVDLLHQSNAGQVASFQKIIKIIKIILFTGLGLGIVSQILWYLGKPRVWLDIFWNAFRNFGYRHNYRGGTDNQHTTQ